MTGCCCDRHVQKTKRDWCRCAVPHLAYQLVPKQRRLEHIRSTADAVAAKCKCELSDPSSFARSFLLVPKFQNPKRASAANERSCHATGPIHMSTGGVNAKAKGNFMNRSGQKPQVSLFSSEPRHQILPSLSEVQSPSAAGIYYGSEVTPCSLVLTLLLTQPFKFSTSP